MCGKFTQMASWGEVVAWSDFFASSRASDSIETVTPMRWANVLHLGDDGKRRMTRMRWGFSRPKPGERFERPDVIHARAETIDSRPLFREAFRARRGILVVRTFNEGEAVSASRTRQHTVMPNDGRPIGIAAIWHREARPEGELHSVVMVTVPANRLIATITDRMPAVLQPEGWPQWLGETEAGAEALKALLRPFEGDWTMAPEVRAPKMPRPKADLFEEPAPPPRDG